MSTSTQVTDIKLAGIQSSAVEEIQGVISVRVFGSIWGNSS